ncbi:MAG: hypothetical protein ABIP93_20080 [Gemmatimonadaceae bacterium]
MLRMLERASSAEDEGTRRALREFVEVLVAEGATPEGTVIALREAVDRAHFLYRIEPLAREHLRTALVSECIDQYFFVNRADGSGAAVARAAERATQQEENDDASESPSG